MWWFTHLQIPPILQMLLTPIPQSHPQINKRPHLYCLESLSHFVRICTWLGNPKILSCANGTTFFFSFLKAYNFHKAFWLDTANKKTNTNKCCAVEIESTELRVFVWCKKPPWTPWTPYNLQEFLISLSRLIATSVCGSCSQGFQFLFLYWTGAQFQVPGS